MVPGGGSTIQTSFRHIIPHLLKTRQIIGFDQRGHGRSPDNDKPYSYVDSALDYKLIQ